MSSFAIFVLILVIVAGALGWRSGFMKQIGQVAGVILGIAVCRIYGPTLVGSFCGSADSGADSVLYTILAYVVLFIVVYVVATLVVRLLRNLLGAVHLGFIDRIAGALFRITEWLVLLSLVLNLWVAIVPSTSLVSDALFARILWFGPFLLGTDTALKLGAAVSSAIGA